MSIDERFEAWWIEYSGGPTNNTGYKVLARDAWTEALKPFCWQPINSAPKDGTHVDLWCKRWRSYNDSWDHQRFPDCYWNDYKCIENARPQWVNLSDNWFPTHWMPLPEPPSLEG